MGEYETLSGITDAIKTYKPKDHVIIWQPWEAIDVRLSVYIEHDYEKNPSNPPIVEEFQEVLVNQKIKCYLLVGCDYSKAYNNIKTNPIENFEVLFWPTAYFHFVYYGFINFYKKTPRELYDPHKKIDKLYLNLNNKDKEHRSLLIDYLCKYDLFDYGVNTWNADDSEYPFKYFKLKKILIDNFDDPTKLQHQKYYSNNLLKINNLVDLITETYVKSPSGHDYLFCTEKTPKFIFFGRPTLILGSLNQNRWMQKFGFQLYTEIFNYDFDDEKYDRSRVLGIIDNLIELKDKNYTEIRDKINNQIIGNMDVASNLVEIEDPFIPDKLKVLIYENKKDYINVLNYFNNIYSYMFGYNESFKITDQIFKIK